MSEPRKPDYTIDCVEGGIANLQALISVICDIRYDLEAGGNDPRVDRLLWVARDLAEGLEHLVCGGNARASVSEGAKQ